MKSQTDSKLVANWQPKDVRDKSRFVPFPSCDPILLLFVLSIPLSRWDLERKAKATFHLPGTKHRRRSSLETFFHQLLPSSHPFVLQFSVMKLWVFLSLSFYFLYSSIQADLQSTVDAAIEVILAAVGEYSPSWSWPQPTQSVVTIDASKQSMTRSSLDLWLHVMAAAAIKHVFLHISFYVCICFWHHDLYLHTNLLWKVLTFYK